jgi:hypothetical protein
MPSKIVDLYFYEELSRLAGHEASALWLLSQCSKRLERSSSRKSTASTGCSSTSSRTPDQSAPASPRGQSSCTEAKAPTGYRERSVSSISESCHKSLSMMQSEVVDSPMDEAMKCIASRSSPSSSFKSDSSIIGLLFTDAAHTVLD